MIKIKFIIPKNKDELLKLNEGELRLLVNNNSGCIDCYDCTDCTDCQNCLNCKNCKNCEDCRDCSYSENLKDARYIFKNIQLTKEEYLTLIERIS